MAEVKNYPPNDAPASDIALHRFLATFGEPEKVKQEAISYWQEKGKLGTPVELYNHLMDARVKTPDPERHISKERAEILKAVFADTFAPEQNTGYLSKHREPLVTGLAQLYAQEVKAHNPVWRIEGDISNLGGLNKAMLQAAKNVQEKHPDTYATLLKENGIDATDPDATGRLGRVMADRILHTICHITLENLEKVADVIPVRKGGDEISFIATMKNGVTPDRMERALSETQTDVAQFVLSAGLELVPHEKYPDNKRKTGIGIGLHHVDLRTHGLDELKGEFGKGIPRSKAEFQAVLHPSLHRDDKEILDIKTPDLRHMEADIGTIGQFLVPGTVGSIPQGPDLNAASTSIPSVQRLMNLDSVLRKADGERKATRAETRAIAGTHMSIRKTDAVTKLPMFEYMQEEQLPYFMKQFGEKNGGTRLVNIDFSNMGGGNKIGEEVGDAMALTYAKVVADAMKASGMEEYKHGLAVRPGGKFALLVPANIANEKMAKFSTELSTRLDAASQEPLPIDPSLIKAMKEEFSLATTIAGELDTEKGRRADLKKMYGPEGHMLFAGKDSISIENIVHLKSGLAGATVVMNMSDKPIDTESSLGRQLKPLEDEATKMQDQILIDRKAQGETAQKSYTHLVTGGGPGGGLPPFSPNR